MILTSLCKWGCTGVAPGLTGGARATPGTPLAPPLLLCSFVSNGRIVTWLLLPETSRNIASLNATYLRKFRILSYV